MSQDKSGIWTLNFDFFYTVSSKADRLWYARAAIQHGWSQSVLVLRHADDKPSVGLLLCRSKDRVVVEYALRNLKRPLGVAEWETTIVEKLPTDLQASLPTVEEIEAELHSLQDE